MITILAEKPSVAREIARIVGAMKKEEGYFTGNGYHVTWALGHLVQPAMPDGYGIKGFRRDSLPVIPERFELVPRQVKTDKGYKADAAAVKQIKVVTKLWNESDSIIVATDCAREGELIFRYLYAYTGCTLPFQRLWISSLTDAAIRKGLKELKDGHEYDSLYQAAKARSEADWLVGINGTQALTVAAGRGTYSVGRVQTPTLAMNGCSMSSGMTHPKPLHTESTLLAAMETAGREGVEDEEARQALKDCGIGTPATRAAIIETLLRREYMVRVKKSLVPTEKGLALYSIVKEMDIADVEMTGRWESELAEIEKGRTPHEAFLRDIEGYTRKITTELLACDKIFGHKASGCACPKCSTGTMQFYGKVVRCDNPDCALPVFRQIAGRTLTDTEMTDLLANGKTGVLNSFKSKQGKPFSAAVAFDADFNTKFIFPEAKGTRKSTNMKGRRK